MTQRYNGNRLFQFTFLLRTKTEYVSILEESEHLKPTSGTDVCLAHLLHLRRSFPPSNFSTSGFDFEVELIRLEIMHSTVAV